MGWTRRDLLKSGVAVPAVVAAAGQTNGSAAAQTPGTSAAGGGRERLLLDFGWRFHLGHASDPAQDFGFSGNFSKTGNFSPAGGPRFDDGDWKPVDLPHDWAIELPFQNDIALLNKGYYPLGRDLSGHQHRLVSPRLRASRLRRGQADLDRVRWRLPGSAGVLERLLHRPTRRAATTRSDSTSRISRLPAARTCCWFAWTPP